MSQGLLWVTIIIVGLLTLGIRLSFMVFMGNTHIPLGNLASSGEHEKIMRGTVGASPDPHRKLVVVR